MQNAATRAAPPDIGLFEPIERPADPLRGVLLFMVRAFSLNARSKRPHKNPDAPTLCGVRQANPGIPTGTRNRAAFCLFKGAGEELM
ncbi:MAG: hypothetical protein CFE28_10255 [Alphaproteobacteria bacterium PA2]|nr:MAG: hypothetical protein CFE28_10255 [Alphaproteobacteria bacterium PA2]